MQITKRSAVSQLRIDPAGSHLNVVLPAHLGRALSYSLRGSVEFSAGGEGLPDSSEPLTIARAYGVATLTVGEGTAGAPPEIGFQLVRPIRVGLSGQTVEAEFELRWPDLVNLEEYRVFIHSHPYSYRPVPAKLQPQSQPGTSRTSCRPI